MKKLILLVGVLIIMTGCQQATDSPKATPNVDGLKRLSLTEVDTFLENKESGILYFGWVTNCGDSVNFQENYLEDYLKSNPDMKDSIYVVDLDDELPDALIDKKLRAPLTEKYDVSFSPTLLRVEDGKTIDKVEWTLKTADPETAIARFDLDNFFNK